MEARTEQDGTRVVTMRLGDIMRADMPATTVPSGSHIPLTDMIAAIAWVESGLPGTFDGYSLKLLGDELTFRFRM